MNKDTIEPTFTISQIQEAWLEIYKEDIVLQYPDFITTLINKN